MISQMIKNFNKKKMTMQLKRVSNKVQDIYQRKSVHDMEKSDVNLESIDAISVKVETKQMKKQTKGANSQGMVKQLLNQHKQKQQQLKKREDDIYVKEQVLKKQPKPARVIVKQKLTTDKATKEQLDDSKLNNQQKAVILQKDLAKKVDAKINVKEVPKQMEIKKPSKESEPKQKVNLFEVRVGQGIKGKLESEQDEQSQKTMTKERALFLEQKKAAKLKAQQQMQEQEEMLRIKQKKVLEDQKVSKDVKVLSKPSQKQEELKNVLSAQKKEKEIEKYEDQKVQLKQEQDILNQLKKEQKSLNQEIMKQDDYIKNLDKQIQEWSQKSNAVCIGGKYQSLKKIRLKEQSSDIFEQTSQQQTQIDIPVDLGEPDISTKVLNRIASNEMTLQDAYAILDEDKDGVLTKKELQSNLPRLNLDLSPADITKFIDLLDTNCQGIITEQKFVQNLTQQLETQKEFREIMGNIKDTINPIVLEERSIHLRLLTKYLNKQLDEENVKSKKMEPDFQRIVKRLKKHESLLEVLRGTNDSNRDLNKIRDDLKVKVREVTNKKQLIVAELQERKSQINLNIFQLNKKIEDLTVQVLSLKDQLKAQQKLADKTNLKAMAFESTRDRYIKEAFESNQVSEMLQAKYFELHQARTVELERQEQEYLKNLKFTHCIILIQKVQRGRRQRKKYLEKKEKHQSGADKIMKVLANKYNLNFKFIFGNIKEVMTVKKQIEKQKQEEEMIKQQKQLDDLQQKKSALMFNMAQQASLTQAEQLYYILPKAIQLQKAFRRLWKQVPLSNMVYNVSFGQGNTNLCQICTQDLAEFICRQCKYPLHCDSCFKQKHKNHTKRNHQFYEINHDRSPLQYKSEIGSQKYGSQKYDSIQES